MNRLEINAGDRLIGLSLPRCIEEIATGVVKIECVDFVISITQITSDDQWKSYLDAMSEHYWSNREDSKRIFWTLLRSGRIRQPRLNNSYARVPDVTLTGKIWVSSELDIKYRDMPPRTTEHRSVRV